jgi:5-methylcytosine-specific restriction protein A
MPKINTLGGGKKKPRPSNQRWTTHDNFYNSVSWRETRKTKLHKDPLCEDCKEKGIIKEAHSVDHIKPRKWWPELSLVIDNLRSLCKSHHAKKSAKEQRITSKEDYELKFGL